MNLDNFILVLRFTVFSILALMFVALGVSTLLEAVSVIYSGVYFASILQFVVGLVFVGVVVVLVVLIFSELAKNNFKFK